MSHLSIKARLALGYGCVLLAATLAVTGGAWWLFRTSMLQAADASLAARVDGTRRFIEFTERELPAEEVEEEFHEFAALTSGETLVEVFDESGRLLCRPVIAGWNTATWTRSPADALEASNQNIAGQPFRAVSTEIVVLSHRYRLAAAIPMSTAYSAFSRFAWLLGGLVPGVMLVAAAGGFWLSSRALAPVDRMTRGVQQISLHHLDRRVDVPPADDELRRLALTFNDLLARLQGAFEDMVRFTAEASHELRTPVSLARTTAEITLARPRTAEEYREALGDVLAHTVRMSHLVDDLLILARADAGMESSEPDAIDLRDAITEAWRDIAPLAARRELNVTQSAPAEPLMVRGSVESLRRLLLILMDNAVKYTPVGGTVTLLAAVTTVGTSRQATVELVDSGPGIPTGDRSRVFDRFYRGMQARQIAADGSGLGLSIARTIVERYGGEIAIADPPAGRGCLVRLVFPLVATSA